MHNIRIFPAVMILSLSLFFSLAGNSQEESVLIITDISGHSEKITSTYNFFEYSDQNNNDIVNHLEVILENSPNERFWIHFTQIKTAGFTQQGDKIGISIECDNGELVSGIFPDNEMKITGKNAFGDISLDVKKLKKLEFNEFEIWRENQYVKADRREASLEWKKTNAMPSSKWIIVDGDKKEEALGMGIRDSYETNVSGLLYYFGRTFRDADSFSYQTESILIQRGVTETKILLGDIDEFTITGKLVEDKPEISIVKKGDRLTAPVLLKTSCIRKSDSDVEIKYGPFDKDDMLIWRIPCGYKGRSLLPPRRIAMTRIQDTPTSPNLTTKIQ